MEDRSGVIGLHAASLEDRDLTLAYQAGEKGAYQAIYDRYQARVHGVCRRMLGNGQDAQDAAQESFLRIYQALGRFNGRYQLGAWITRITTNVCLDHLRARSRRPHDCAQIESIEPTEDRYPERDDPELIALRGAEGHRVHRVLAQLPPLHRAAIVLRDFEGLSYQEVAVALNLTESQVKALLHRARRGFKRSWASVGLAALLPSRWLSRVRRVQAAGKEEAGYAPAPIHQVAETVTALATPASSCASALAHCGHFVAERLAPAVAAAVIGAAALASPAVTGTSSAPHGGAEAGSTDAGASRREATEALPARLDRSDGETASQDPERDPGEPTVLEEDEGSEEETPSEAPVPVASPSSSPTGSPEPPSSPPPSPAYEPEPQGFSFSFETDVPFEGRSCACLEETSVRDETLSSSNEAGLISFSQSVSGTATATGQRAYGLRLQHAGEPGRPYSASLVLATQEGDYGYLVDAQIVSRARTAWGGWMYVFQGTYELTSRPSQGETVPTSGAYSLTMALSTSQQRIVSADVRLTE